MEEKKKILLIDDEEDFCFFVQGNLENTGDFEVVYTGKGRKGVELAKSEKPDLILLDVVMPEMSGQEVAEELLEDPETEGIPIIFLTAIISKKDKDADTLRKIGGRNFVAKPVNTEELVGAIRNVLEL